MVKTLLFDLGGVLVEVNSADRLAELAGGGVTAEEMSQRWATSKYLRMFESGQCDELEFAAGICGEMQLPLTPDEFLAEFSLFTKGFYPGAADLLQALRSNHTLACLSDTNALQWDSMCERFSVDRYFDHHFLSFEIGALKPHPHVYEYVLKSLGCAPDEIAYFDDRLGNVQAGARAGMRAHCVAGTDELKKKLLELKITR